MSNRLKRPRASDDKISTRSPSGMPDRPLEQVSGGKVRTYPARYNTIALLGLLLLACLVAGFSMWVILRRH